jgi:hypothetical protein
MWLDGLWKNYEKPQSGRQVSGPRFDPGPSKYEAGVLSTRPRHQVVTMYRISN